MEQLPKDLENIIYNYKNGLEKYEELKEEMKDVFLTKDKIHEYNLLFFRQNTNNNIFNYLVENINKDICIKKSNSIGIYGMIDKIIYLKKKYIVYI